jgi:hypothetical protein
MPKLGCHVTHDTKNCIYCSTHAAESTTLHPSFFKIPVTHELTRCVEYGTFPLTPTVVIGHVPDIPRPNRRFSEGMKPLDNRRAILQCYEAFKKFIV